MRLVFILLCLVFYGDGSPSPYDYHRKIGIPKANKLRESDTLDKETRIIGGSLVQDELVIPHQAGILAILTTGWTSACGGALLSHVRVLTAAHCWYDGVNQARLFNVVLGSVRLFTGGTRVPTSTVVVHPSWNTLDVTHDIAMVIIPSIVTSNSIQPIPLPTMAEVNEDFSGMAAMVSGYGKTSDDQNFIPISATLYQTTVNIITNAVCQNSFPNYNLHAGHLCTSGDGGVGTCEGDSGGPLTVVRNMERILVGIVSFGPEEGCERGLPSVYTRVPAFLNWIQANM